MINSNVRIADMLLSIFGGNPYYAEGKQSSKGGAFYQPVHSPLTIENLLLHLEGKQVLGSYPVLTGTSNVRWMGWDIDAKGDIQTARKFVSKITALLENIQYAVEFSGGKGYHILVFLEEEMDAKLAKAVSEEIRDQADLPKVGPAHVECYPKQGELVRTGGTQAFGNLLKIPLGQHVVTHNWSVFVNPENGWEDGPIIDPEEVLSWRTPAKDLMRLVKIQTDKMAQIAEAVAKDWVDGRRHELALYLSGYLVQKGWVLEQTVELVEKICDLRGDNELGDRIQTVRDTYKKYHKGQRVGGFMRLQEIMSPVVLNKLNLLSGDLAAPDMARKIEAIRLAKGQIWLKEKQVASLIISHLIDPEVGKLLRSAEGHLTFWYDQENKRVVHTDSREWEQLLHSMYQLNIAEVFVKHVESAIRLYAESQGEKVNIYQGSFYDGKMLYVHLGGKEVYLLDGDNIQISFNGASGVYFRTKDSDKVIVPDWESDPINVWEFLIDDLNFSENEQTPIHSEAQKEIFKAWILATFFREILPTRPILAVLGAAGSGKTTALRKVLRLFEGLTEQPLDAQEDKQDWWRSVIEKHRLVMLDNLEKMKGAWMARSLDTIATGAKIEIRKLYETNRVYTIRPNVFVALSAVNMPFSKETLFERMLILNLGKMGQYIPEQVFWNTLEKNIGVYWADLLRKLNIVVLELQNNPTARIPFNIRMADFASFCTRIEGSEGVVDPTQLRMALTMLRSAQSQALAQSEHSAFPLIEEWVRSQPQQAAKPQSAGDLYIALSNLAVATKRIFRWKDGRGLGQHLRALESVLSAELGCIVEKRYHDQNRQFQKFYSFPSAVDIYGEEKDDETTTQINTDRN